MNKKNLLFVIGTRPNFIKIAPICRLLNSGEKFPFKIVHTGQHYDAVMSDIFFDELNIPQPDFYLETGSGSHAWQTGKTMMKLEELCQEHSFSAIVAIGDVNSTLAAALVGAKQCIPVVHIESGLRSHNRSMPEEINRIATDHVSDLLFAPTKLAMQNLENEGLTDRSIFSGDVMYDMALVGLELARQKTNPLKKLGLDPENYYLATLHRPYNVDEPEQLRQIIDGFSQLEKPVILSAHPRLKKNLELFGIRANGNIRMTQPFGYLDFISLQKNAAKVITDSGGVQKEAFFVQTPCVTLRPETEWVETVETGANILVKKRMSQEILDAVQLKNSPRFHEKPYGEGNASEIILDVIQSRFYNT